MVSIGIRVLPVLLIVEIWDLLNRAFWPDKTDNKVNYLDKEAD